MKARLLRHSLVNLLALTVGVTLALVGQSASAASGYKLFPKEERVAPITLDLQDGDLSCSDVDFWGQSDLLILLDEADLAGVNLPLPINGVSRLYDGGCDADYAALVARGHQGPIKAGLYLKSYEIITWGIISEGSDNERPYCDHKLKLFVYLTNDPLFPQYEYQSGNELKIADLDYAFCVEQYGGE